MKNLKFASVLLAPALLGACLQYRDVTHDPAFHTDYRVDGIYRLKRDAVRFKDRDESPEQPYWHLMAPGRSFAAHLANVEEVRSHPEEWKGFEIVRAGTLVRFNRLELFQSIDSFYVAAFGRFVDGPFVGDKLNLREVSRVEGDMSIFIDPSWLEPISH